MAGKAGTPRFGINPSDESSYKAGSDGIGYKDLPDGTKQEEIHYTYNPAYQARAVGQAPGRCYEQEKRQADYMANHDGYVGGMAHNLELDERKVLDNTINSVKVKYEADDQNISGTKGMFD